MSDLYINQFETQAYGPFTVDQIGNLVVGLMPDFDQALKSLARLLDEGTKSLGELLGENRNLSGVTYKAAGEQDSDPVAEARDILEQLSSFAASRKKLGDMTGKALAQEILRGESISTIKKRRPVKLTGYLSHAITTVESNRQQLEPEAEEWLTHLRRVLTSLQLLTSRVKKARSLQHEMTPEVGAAYDSWQTTYRAAKHQVEAVLLLCGKTSMMSLVFDDLAEVHQVAGVSDGEAPAETAAPTVEVATPAPDPTEPTV